MPTAPPRSDPVDDFSCRVLSLEETPTTMYVAGSGPAVILMPEMPGISPDVARFARWIRDAGFTVYLPSLFGVDGAYPAAEYGEQVIKRACVSKESRALDREAASWLGSRDRTAILVWTDGIVERILDTTDRGHR